MGRYSVLLAPQLADFATIAAGQRALDVGCGPGALTTELVRRLRADFVSAVDPSETFVAATRERHPGVDVRLASAEQLPFADETFDGVLAQLVVHFMADPKEGLSEMVRVIRPGGVVAACVWDHAGGQGPLSLFWDAARELDPEVEDTALTVSAEHPSFDDWWEPFTLGVGPTGSYTASLDARRQAQLRERCREALPAAPFVLRVQAWAARGIR